MIPSSESIALLDAANLLLEEVLPWSSSDGALVLALAPSFDEEGQPSASPLQIDEAGNLNAALVLVYFDPVTAEVVNANEQPVKLVPDFALHARGRAGNYLRGLTSALSSAVLRVPEDQSLLPAHLLFTELFEDTTLNSASDFARAITKSERLRTLT
jgi:hypothetical protein